MLEKINSFLLNVAESIVELAVMSRETLSRTLAIFKVHARSKINDVVLLFQEGAFDILITYFKVSQLFRLVRTIVSRIGQMHPSLNIR